MTSCRLPSVRRVVGRVGRVGPLGVVGVVGAVAVVAGALVLGGCAEPPRGPRPPVLGPVESPTSSAVQTIVGGKQAATAIEVSVNGAAPVVVKLDDATQWTAAVSLSEGANAIAAVAVDAVGRRSGEALAVILLDTAPPAPPDVDAIRARTLLEDVAVTGTVSPGDDVIVNGEALALAGAASFATTLALDVGANLVRVAARDIAGNESAVQEHVIERLAELPFTVDVPPPLVNAAQAAGGLVAISGTRDADVEVSVNGVVPAAADVAGRWTVSVPVTSGVNDLTVIGVLAGEPASAVELDFSITVDLADPLLAVSSPLAGDVIDGVVAVTGTASDAEGPVLVFACAGAPEAAGPPATCADAADFTALTLTGGAFTGDLDVSADPTIDDGQLFEVLVRAVDAAGNETLVTTAVLLFRAPIPVGLPGTTTAIDLGADAVVGGAIAWANAAGAAGVSLDGGGGGWSPLDRALAAGGASSPRVARAPSSITHIVWIEGDDLMYASDDGLAHLVASGVPDPVLSADVSFDPDDATGATALVAFAQGTSVRTTIGSGDAWSGPTDISDATTSGAAAGPSDVVVADGGVAVAWLETSDRDGALDDADVVLVSRAAALFSAPILVSADGGAFVDFASSAPQLAALGTGEVAVAWLDESRGVVAIVDVSAAPVAGVPREVTNVPGGGAASALFIGADTLGGGDLLVGWLDDGAALLAGASAPALIARRGPLAALGPPLVISTTPASSPAGFLAGPVAQLAWIEGGGALLFAVELP